MLAQVLNYLNNHFVDEMYTGYIEDGDLIVENHDLIAGQHIAIRESRMNDGIYKILSIENDIIVVDGDITNDNRDFIVYGLMIPKEVVDLATSLETSDTDIQSESLGDYSVTFKNFQEQFGRKLSNYRKVYRDI